MKLKNKKALESEVLIGIIITVIVAAVIFLFIRGWTWKGMIDREACHQSVLMRSMPSVIGESMKASIPLKCKTEDILINFDDEELIKQRIANAMYDCWWMLGEGNLDFFSEGFWKGKASIGFGKSACVVCSTIKFNDNIKNKISSVDVNDYLQNTKIYGKDVTYLEYFADQKDAKLEIGAKVADIDTSKEYAVFYMGIKGGDIIEVIKKDASQTGQILAGSFFLAGPQATGKLLSLMMSKAGLITILSVFILQEFSTIQSQIAAAAHCDLNTEGCNLVILTEYNQEQIAKTCGKIESIP